MEKKQMIVSGHRIGYFQAGRGEKNVLLLHGYLESSEIWEEFSGALSGEVRLIVPDLPGHGDSEVPGGKPSIDRMAEMVFELMDKLGIERFTVAGHSMGGYVALAMAGQQASRLEGFCLFHSTPFADTGEKKENRERGIELIRQGKKNLLVGQHVPSTFALHHEQTMQKTIEAIRERALKTPDKGVIYVLEAMKNRPDRTRTLKELKIPVLLVHGMHDRFISLESLKRIHALVPRSVAVILENSGHMGFLEEPQEAAEHLLRFFRQIKV
ncbi:MAG: alpha/beta fold hydrolase [Bacteroidales bacterium]